MDTASQAAEEAARAEREMDHKRVTTLTVPLLESPPLSYPFRHGGVLPLLLIPFFLPLKEHEPQEEEQG